MKKRDREIFYNINTKFKYKKIKTYEKIKRLSPYELIEARSNSTQAKIHINSNNANYNRFEVLREADHECITQTVKKREKSKSKLENLKLNYNLYANKIIRQNIWSDVLNVWSLFLILDF